jgi:hypothetical protein
VTDLPPRASRRLQRPRWFDARLVGGVLVVLASVLVGARLFATAQTTTAVWEAARALTPGEQLTASDLTVARVRLGAAQHSYISATAPLPAGYVVVQPVGAHQLLPFAAVATSRSRPSTRIVAVPVAQGHFDAGLVPGDVVDVYVTPRAASGAAAVGPTRLVLSGATVDARQGAGLGGSTTTVLVTVPAGQVTALVQAGETGAIDLVDDPARPGT